MRAIVVRVFGCGCGYTMSKNPCSTDEWKCHNSIIPNTLCTSTSSKLINYLIAYIYIIYYSQLNNN